MTGEYVDFFFSQRSPFSQRAGFSERSEGGPWVLATRRIFKERSEGGEGSQKRGRAILATRRIFKERSESWVVGRDSSVAPLATRRIFKERSEKSAAEDLSKTLLARNAPDFQGAFRGLSAEAEYPQRFSSFPASTGAAGASEPYAGCRLAMAKH